MFYYKIHGVGIAVLHVDETFTFDKEKVAQGVYGTIDYHILVLLIQCP